jgi:PAS domain S-box-containing protein
MTETPGSARTERLQRLLDFTSDGIWTIDVRGQCTYCNATAARLLGYQPQDLVGKGLHELVHPGGRHAAPADCALCESLQAAPHAERVDLEQRRLGALLHRDGRSIPVAYITLRLDLEAGAESRVLAFNDDSGRRHLEAQLRERTAEVADNERRKVEFIATLAHELRNPLAPIRAALQVMRKAADDATSMAQVRDLMERQLGQMVRLVDDLLDIARLTSGQMRLQKERVALADILALAIEASAPLMTRANHVVHLEPPQEPVYLHADAIRLAQVFTNILNNAAQYSPPGSPVTVRVESEHGTLRVDVADAGVGIAREALNRIFDMFTKVGRDAPGAQAAGLGVGLNLARRLVEMHGGRLVAASDGPGKGSHFLVTLPTGEAMGSAPAPASGTQPGAERGTAPAPGAVRVLLVDDNVDAAASLSLLLQLGGHSTRVAHNGPEALRIAGEFLPDIVLLDLGLPGLNGYEVARAIRALPQLGRPFLAAVTGWGAPEDRERSKAAGFDEHLTKPVDISMIELLLSTLPARSDGRAPPVQNGRSVEAAS